MPADPSYKITEISFSLRTRVESTSERTEDHIVGGVPFKRITTLVVHITYEYLGLFNTKEYGTAIADVADVCTVTFDDEGKATSMVTEEMPDRDAILSLVETEVEKAIESNNIEANERAFTKNYLAEISKGYEENGELVSWESRFTPQQDPVYEELEDWNTGIGAVGYNVLELDPGK